jgi:DNA-binding response OmpR family regulator
MGLELDVTNQTASWNHARLDLTKTEFELLAQMVTYPGQVLSHAFLTEQIWGYTNVGDAALVKNHISSLRRKLRSVGGDGRMIRTLHGIGYSFVPL